MAGSPQVRRARRKASVRPSPGAPLPLSNVARRPVVKVYGKKSKYMPEGASVYERARALRKAAKT